MSGRQRSPATAGPCLRNRRPRRCSSERRATSGRVSLERLPCMTRRTPGDDASGGGGSGVVVRRGSDVLRRLPRSLVGTRTCASIDLLASDKAIDLPRRNTPGAEDAMAKTTERRLYTRSDPCPVSEKDLKRVECHVQRAVGVVKAVDKDGLPG